MFCIHKLRMQNNYLHNFLAFFRWHVRIIVPATRKIYRDYSSLLDTGKILLCLIILLYFSKNFNKKSKSATVTVMMILINSTLLLPPQTMTAARQIWKLVKILCRTLRKTAISLALQFLNISFSISLMTRNRSSFKFSAFSVKTIW